MKSSWNGLKIQNGLNKKKVRNKMKLVELYSSEQFKKESDRGMIKTVIVGKDGTYEEQNSWLGTSLKKVHDYGVITFPEVTEFVKVKNVNVTKIPAIAIKTVMKWYKDITDKNGEEAQVNFYLKSRKLGGTPQDGIYKLTYTEEDEFGIETEKTVKLEDIPGLNFWNDDVFSYTPKQENSHGQTSTDDPIYTALNQQYGMFLETHSHNSMKAFCSGTDYANSQNDAVQLVFGTFKGAHIEMYNWITVSQKLQEGFDAHVLEKFVEFPTYSVNTAEKKLNFDFSVLSGVDETILEEWDKQVIKPKPIVRSFGYGSGYANTIWSTSDTTRSPWTPKHGSTVTSYKSTSAKIKDAVDSAIISLLEMYGPEAEAVIEKLVAIYSTGISNSTYVRMEEAEIEDEIITLVSDAIDELF